MEEQTVAPTSPPPINYNIYYENGYINYESPVCMFISAVLWRLLYYIFRGTLPEKSAEYCDRLTSALHGLVSAFMGINQCFLFDWPFDHPEWKTSYVQSFIMTMSFGYFVHDTIWMIKYDRKDTLMICHHVFCVVALIKMIFKGYSGAQATCALGSMEITNPFLQARWYLRDAGMKETALFKSTEISFVLIFIGVRIIIGSYFLNIILRQPKNDWDFVLLAVGIYVMSWKFAWNMIKLIIRKYYVKQHATAVAGGAKDQ